MQYHYNLIDEPWIPCIFLNGEFKYLGLKKVFSSAAEIKEIHAELPPMTASMLFLLLAILYRTQKIETDTDWEDIWQSGSFDQKKIEDYFQQWYQRFDLFDPDHPFYQDPLIGQRPKDLKNLDGKDLQIKGVNSLILHSSSGDAATLFDHTIEDQEPSFSLDQISRLLLMFQGFSLGGMTSASVSADKYYNDSPHARGVVYFLRENNLFKTLLLNLIAKREWRLSNSNHDIPAWELDDVFTEDRKKPLGMIDFLTWQSRRIKLVPYENNGVIEVKNLYVNPGLGLSDELENPFFNIHYNEAANGKLEKKILRFTESKALWRDSTVILEPNSRLEKPPEALTWANSLKSENIFQGHINLSAHGLSTDPGKKKAFFYREENFDFPFAYLKNENLRNQLNRSLDLAKDIQSQLWGALRQLAGLILSFNADKKDGRKAAAIDEQNMMIHWGTEDFYWRELEVPFYRLIHQIPENPEQAIEDWKELLRLIAIRSFEQAVTLSGNSTSVLKASAKAKRQLLFGIRKIINPEEKEE